MKIRQISCCVAAAVLFAVTLFAQAPPGGLTPGQLRLKAKADNAPNIPYETVPNFIKMPPNLYMGEGIGITTNSKGHIFYYGPSQTQHLFEFDAKGNFVKEIGPNIYGWAYAHIVRCDSQDNIWVVDEGTNTIMKFNPEGTRITMVLGRRPEFPFNGIEAPLPYAEQAPPYLFNRPTDIGWDAAGNIFVSDGYVNARVVKYDKNGRFIKQVGRRGSGPTEFNLPHDLVVDNQGNVYVGSRSDQRIVVLDNDLNPKAVYDHVGAPWALCITSGPHQYLYSSNANPDSQDTTLHVTTGQVYKMELDGTVLGKFGVPGKEPGQFGTAHGLDCRIDNEILTAEIVTWRVQKLLLHPSANQGGKK